MFRSLWFHHLLGVNSRRNRRRTGAQKRRSVRPSLEGLEDRLTPSALPLGPPTINVTNGGPVTNTHSLAHAIQQVDNNTGQPFTINIQNDLTLAQNNPVLLNTAGVDIVGNGHTITNGADVSGRLFTIGASAGGAAEVAFRNLTLTGGSVSGTNGGFTNATLQGTANAVFTPGAAGEDGGGAIGDFGGIVHLTQVNITGNKAFLGSALSPAIDGGGIYLNGGGTVIVNGAVTISNNSAVAQTANSTVPVASASAFGGGVYISGLGSSFTVGPTNSTFSMTNNLTLGGSKAISGTAGGQQDSLSTGDANTATPSTNAPNALLSLSIASSQTTFSLTDQSVTVSATVVSDGSPVTEGTVTFTLLNSSGQTVGSVTSPMPVDSDGTTPSVALLVPGGTAAGNYTIQASYSDSTGTFMAPPQTEVLSIVPGTADLSVSTTPSTLAAGPIEQTPTVTATVTTSITPSVPSATVTVSLENSSSGAVLGSSTSAVAASNNATTNTTLTVSANTSPGNYKTTASSNDATTGDLTATSTSTSASVTPASTSLTLSPTAAILSRSSAQSVAVSATITSNNGAPISTGTVAFSLTDLKGQVVSSAVVNVSSNGTANTLLTVPASAPGSYTLAAVYVDSSGAFATSLNVAPLPVNAPPPPTQFQAAVEIALDVAAIVLQINGNVRAFAELSIFSQLFLPSYIWPVSLAGFLADVKANIPYAGGLSVAAVRDGIGIAQDVNGNSGGTF